MGGSSCVSIITTSLLHILFFVRLMGGPQGSVSIDLEFQVQGM